MVSMSGVWATILPVVVVLVVRALIDRSSRDREALRQAAVGTPEMAEAGRLFAQRQVVRQRARLSRDLRSFGRVRLPVQEVVARGKIGKTERPALTAIEQPEIEDPAA